jgi:hypothetical protein
VRKAGILYIDLDMEGGDQGRPESAWREPRFGTTERTLAQLACIHAFLRWSRPRARESGDALVEDGYYLIEGNWWRDLTDQVQSDHDFMLGAFDLLESSSEPAHRALAGEVLVGHQLHLAAE